ncbi:MAG TPA: ATP-binding cassette domain-containing protein [Burkholderiales bacterium]|nr:ATP-binding cassette domain-containing protein [Burkholderiales bacterium]
MSASAPQTAPASEAPAALEAGSLRKSFRIDDREIVALRDVSFRARSGVVTGLIGPDAAGKTTLMRLAAGLLVPDGGRISVFGLDATREALAVQSMLGYMPQRFGLYEDLSVQENLDLYADLQGVPHQARTPRYRELMHMTGLGPFTARLAGRLSGGMKQKLGLACTLLRAPRLLLLDEPTVGVDPVSRRELWAIVHRLVEEQAMSVLLSTAYLDEAERCHEVVLLHEGELMAAGAPARIGEGMLGRTFLARVPGTRKRDLQRTMSVAPQVLDATIQADGVRVVTRQPDEANAIAALAAGFDARIETVRPSFEDGFVALLHEDARPPQAAAAPAAAAPAAGAGEIVIEVREVVRRFGDFVAVDRISFDVRRGEIFGLLGPNGAGKSTTFRMLCGLLPASAGTLRVAGLDLRHAASKARARIGYVSQKFSLYGNLSARQNLEFFASVYGLSGARRRERLAWAVSEFELSGHADLPSGDLSLGHKQRLAMACALMHEPDILFLDEPTSGVDPLARREFWRRIDDLARGGVTVLVTTHFMQEAEYCDRLAIISAGRILAMGDPAGIKAGGIREGAPAPTMEEAFIALVEADARPGRAQ